MGSLGDIVRIIVPLLLITLLYAQTYYLSYGVKMTLTYGGWHEKAQNFVESRTPFTKPAVKITLGRLVDNTTVTVFLPIEGNVEKIVGDASLYRNDTLRVVLDREKELVVVGDVEVGKPLVVKGEVEKPPVPTPEKPSTELEVVEEREVESTVVEEPTADEEERKQVVEVLNVSKPPSHLNLPPLSDVFLMVVISAILIAISLIIRHHRPKERKGREPITPYTYEVEIKKPPVGEE